jgi:nitroreductase
VEFDFIYRRHSVRKFKPDPVNDEHIGAIITAATYAPSGKNAQNWHFVVVTDKSKITEIAHIVEQENSKLVQYLTDEKQIKAFTGALGYQTVFKNAPVLVLVYAGHYDTVADMLTQAGVMAATEISKYAKPDPGIQNVAAAMENLHLAAASLGYGTCWMTGPTYAAEAISDYLGFKKDGYHLAALTPLGIPLSDKISSPPRKPLAEVLTVIR